MPDLLELYQDTILDHYKKPRNFRALEFANRHADGYNSFCGDSIRVYLQFEDGIVKDISFTGSGCAISTSSASMMTEILKGKKEGEVRIISDSFHHILTDHTISDTELAALGDLAAFSGVRGYPVRIRCAILAWQTMWAALQKQPGIVSTE
jgi:nitrogen fixation NifU-like protein